MRPSTIERLTREVQKLGYSSLSDALIDMHDLGATPVGKRLGVSKQTIERAAIHLGVPTPRVPSLDVQAARAVRQHTEYADIETAITNLRDQNLTQAGVAKCLGLRISQITELASRYEIRFRSAARARNRKPACTRPSLLNDPSIPRPELDGGPLLVSPDVRWCPQCGSDHISADGTCGLCDEMVMAIPVAEILRPGEYVFV